MRQHPQPPAITSLSTRNAAWIVQRAEPLLPALRRCASLAALLALSCVLPLLVH